MLLKLAHLLCFQTKSNGQKRSVEVEEEKEEPGSDSEVQEDNGNPLMVIVMLAMVMVTVILSWLVCCSVKASTLVLQTISSTDKRLICSYHS